MSIKYKINELTIEKRAFINGKFCTSVSKHTMSKKNSAEGELIEGIAACVCEDVNLAVKSAKEVYDSGVWSKQTIIYRKSKLLNLADLMEKNKEELALLDTYETGRAYKNYIHDSIPKAIECIRYFAEAVDKIYDAFIPSNGKESGLIVRNPVGVVGLITPWNDPLVVSAWKFAPALLMGNSVIIKPAEQSTLSILKVAQLANECGIPAGVFNVVPGYGEEVGKCLAMHMDVGVISFTGSSEVGKLILQYAGKSNMKKVYLECGGKSPYIVSDKCKNIRLSAKVLAQNMFYNQGQICSAPSRVIVDRKVKNEFIDALKHEMEKYVPGDPYNENNDVGCVVNKEQQEKIINYLNCAKKDGAELYQAKTVLEKNENAACIQPTIVMGLTNGSLISREEVFGPVVVILESDSIYESVKIANDTKYGLASAVWSNDLDEVRYVVSNLQAGLVHVNSYGDDDNRAPFGGVKESGIGKDKSLFAFDEFCEKKTVWMSFKDI